MAWELIRVKAIGN